MAEKSDMVGEMDDLLRSLINTLIDGREATGLSVMISRMVR